MSSLLTVENLGKEYVTGGETLRILSDISFALDAGETLAVVGPSGSGKTTLLNILGTLDAPTSGRVLLEGRDFSKLDEKAAAALRHRRIGFVFQFHHLLPHCTLLENALVPMLAGADDPEAVEKRARRLLDRVGLGSRLDHPPARLSGGERQRAAVVRALVNRPALLLADEPTGSLDRRHALELVDLLLELNRDEGTALIVVTHSMEIARRLGRTVELRDGRLEAANE